MTLTQPNDTLRTHHLGYLDLAQPDNGKKSEHDMKMLKRQDLETLRDKGPKVRRRTSDKRRDA